MFFMACYKNNIISNMPAFMEIINLISNNTSKQTLLNFSLQDGPVRQSTVIEDIELVKIEKFITFYRKNYEWSLSISIEQLLYFDVNYTHIKDKNFIITFDGDKLNFLDYNIDFLASLVANYSNKDVYISVGLINTAYTDVYSTNNEAMRLLYFFLGEAFLILLSEHEIINALANEDKNQYFGANREIWARVLDHNYLMITEDESSVQYKIHKDVFFKLLNTFNAHEHAANKMCCAKTTIIIDDKEVCVDLID